MPKSFTSFHIRNGDGPQVERIARNTISKAAYISPSRNGWISLYDEATDLQDPAELHRLATTISASLGSLVLGVLVRDDDVLVYVLYDKGTLRDEHSSQPDCFGPVDAARAARLRGRPEVVWEYCPDSTVQEVEQALSEEVDPSDDMAARLRAQMGQAGLPLGGADEMQKVMQMAVEQARNMPPAMLKMMLSGMGIPVDHPAIQPMLANPAAFLQSMMMDPDQMRRFQGQFGMGAPNTPQKPSAGKRAERLGQVLGIDPIRVSQGFTSLADDSGAGFERIEA